MGLESREFGSFGKVSSLTLGGGGIGQVWGSTTREEAIATVKLAVDEGINHFDLAPMYGRGEAERVIGLAFSGLDLSAIKFTTKCLLGNVRPEVWKSVKHNFVCPECQAEKQPHASNPSAQKRKAIKFMGMVAQNST